MTWVRADALAVGMRTTGGQEILSIDWTGFQYQITWSSTPGGRPAPVGYFPDQQFDMAAPTGATEQKEEKNAMAQKVNIIVESDLSGAEGASTVTFGLDGHAYEVDLTDKEAEKFRDAFAKYIGVGRPVKGSRSNGTARRASQQQIGPSAKEIREWAVSNGHTVPERGRIPAEVREAFESAH